MRVLFIGDVVGDAGVALVERRLPGLRDQNELDLVVANGENAEPGGNGLSESALERLIGAGVDVLTGGNHSWERPSLATLSHPRVLRPLNVPDEVPGRGWLTVDCAAGSLTVVNLGDRDAIVGTRGAPDHITPALDAFARVDPRGAIIVDIHAEHVFSKQALAHALDGRVAAVLGTHTHEPTLTIHRLPSGTVLVTDVGMTGAAGGVMGFEPGSFVAGLRRGVVLDGPTPKPVRGQAVLGAVLLDVDGRDAATVAGTSAIRIH
jgi:2',3'-cyclic-nucleotide 2'-phosphodiesterase